MALDRIYIQDSSVAFSCSPCLHQTRPSVKNHKTNNSLFSCILYNLFTAHVLIVQSVIWNVNDTSPETSTVFYYECTQHPNFESIDRNSCTYSVSVLGYPAGVHLPLSHLPSRLPTQRHLRNTESADVQITH